MQTDEDGGCTSFGNPELMNILTFCDQVIYVPLTKSLFKSAGRTVSHFFSMLPSNLKYLYSVEPVRMHFTAKQPCTNDTVCNAACSIAHAGHERVKLCKILREFPDKFREYYRMNTKTFYYILDSVKDDMQGYSTFRKCIEAEENLTVALWYILVIVRININYICTVVNVITIQCNLKGNYTSKIKSYTKLQ
jgi:hypothetical protein